MAYREKFPRRFKIRLLNNHHLPIINLNLLSYLFQPSQNMARNQTLENLVNTSWQQINLPFQELIGSSLRPVQNPFKFTVIWKPMEEAGPWFTVTPLQIITILRGQVMP